MPTPDGTPLQGGVYDPRNEALKKAKAKYDKEIKELNTLDDFLRYAKKQHHLAWVTCQKPSDAARNLTVEFMTPWELLKFSIECLVASFRKAIGI